LNILDQKDPEQVTETQSIIGFCKVLIAFIF